MKQFVLILMITSMIYLDVKAQESEVEELVVSVSFIPDEKRDTSEISSVLTSESMSIAGDNEAADALKRVTGLSLVKGKYVYVRGLGERYSSALLNGVLLPSPEPLKRVVPFDIFPTSVLENVLVQKTYSPQYPGEFGGGVIDMRTKIIPDQEFFEFGFSTGYDSLSTGTSAPVMEGYNQDWTGFAGDNRNLPASLAPFYENSDFVSFLSGTFDQLLDAGRNFGGQWAPVNESLPANFGVDFTYGNNYENNFGRFGVLFSAGYDSSNSFIPDIERTNFVRGSGETLVPYDTYIGEKSNKQIDSNLLATIGWDLDGLNYLQFTNLTVRKTDNRLTLLQGRNPEADFFASNTKMEWVERQINSATLSGNHDLTSGLTIDWRISHADGKRQSPFEREYFYECGASIISDCDGQYEFSRRSDSNATQFSWLDDNSDELAIDFVYPFSTTARNYEIKFGVKQLEKNRETNVKRYRFLPDFVNGAIFSDPAFRRLPIDQIMASENFRSDRTGLLLVEETLNTDDYLGEMTIDAAYIAVESSLSDSIELSVGARQESSEINVVTQTFFGGQSSSVSNDELDKLLPALTITYEFAESMQVRFGYSETLSRPQFREMSPVLFSNFDTDRQERGFLGLKSSEITNIDIRYEWYFGFDEFLTLSYFNKDFINPIEQVLEASATSSFVSYRNALSAELNGAEFEFQKQFGELIEGYDFFGKINFTLTDSNAVTNPEFVVLSSYADRPLVGQPDSILNLQLGFYGSDDSRFSVVYNDVGERIRELGSDVIPNVLEDLPPLLDMVYKKEFQRNDGVLSLSLKWRNILEEPYEATQGGNIFESYSSASSFSVGLEYSF
jgi:TonB-dependent receptor